MIAVSVKPCIVMCILPNAGAISTSAEFLSSILSLLCLVYNEVLTFDMYIHVRVPSHPYMWILEGTQHAV